MKKEFVVQPYIAVGEIKFGATENQIIKILGEPQKIIKTYFGDRNLECPGISIVLEKECVAEVTLSPEISLIFEGCNLFNEKNVIDYLMQFDGQPIKSEGWLVFKKLGIAICNFEYPDQTPVISVGRKGY